MLTVAVRQVAQRCACPVPTNAIEHLDLLLGLKDEAGNDVPVDKRPAWDLIHLNVGLGDLIYCVPNIKSHRSPALRFRRGDHGRMRQQYEKNLDTPDPSDQEESPPGEDRLGEYDTDPRTHMTRFSSRAARSNTIRSHERS